jgi:hypothetical protein
MFLQQGRENEFNKKINSEKGKQKEKNRRIVTGNKEKMGNYIQPILGEINTNA